jgi:hypothetical protein
MASIRIYSLLNMQIEYIDSENKGFLGCV